MTDEEKARREMEKLAKFGAAYGMGSQTFANAVQESQQFSQRQLDEMTRAMAAQIWRTIDMTKFKVFHDEVAHFIPPGPTVKEETIVEHRFGERKPYGGKRLYRLWIDGQFIGDFKSKAERRRMLENTKALMEPPEPPRTVTFRPPKLSLFDDLPPDSYF